jgi:autotransporter-associated beta strand protein
MNRPTNITRIFSALILMLCIHASDAGSATWKRNARSGDWNTKTNWTPAHVPNASADTATFDLSNTTNVSISANTEVNGITFTPAASAYTITANPTFTLTISGTGITNNSGTTQNFVTAVDGAGNFGQIFLTNSATAGTSSIFTNNGSAANFVQGGETAFFNTSTAGNSTFINKGATTSSSEGGRTVFYDSSTAGNAHFTNNSGMGTSTSATIFHNTATAANGTFVNSGGSTGFVFGEGGQTVFFDTSTAANGTFFNNGATASGGFGGATVFDDSSTAGNGIFTNNGGAASGVAALGGGNTIFLKASNAANGTFINNAATASDAEGGVTEFETAFSSNNASPSAGNGTFINNGATISGAVGGKTAFYESSTADAATLIANGGTNGGSGGAIFFEDNSTGRTARIEVFGNGFLDMSGHLGALGSPSRPARVTVGSIEGDGNVFLGRHNLTVGSNNLSTTFSGVMQEGGHNDGIGGSLTKIGSGTLDLTGVNTYTGNTNINSGVLKVDGSITSNTFVNLHGTLAGTGTVIGNVTNNRGGTVSPGDAPGTLTVNSYTQMSGSTLLIDIAGPNTGQFSVLDVLGNANVNPNGLLLPVLLNGFVPTVGESFTFLDYSALTGTFFIFDRNIDNATEHWDVTYQSKDAILTVAPGNVSVPDWGSTLLLLTLSLLAVLIRRCQFLRKRA